MLQNVTCTGLGINPCKFTDQIIVLVWFKDSLLTCGLKSQNLKVKLTKMCCIITDLPVSEMSAPRSEVHNVSRTRDDSQGRLIERLFTFSCDDCGRTYGSSTKLSRHRRDKHGPQLSCYHCGKEFAQSRRWALEIHVKTCKAKFRYRAHDERNYEVNRGQHANRRQEYHPYKSVPQSNV